MTTQESPGNAATDQLIAAARLQDASELLELIGRSNRIAIMSQGRITATVAAPVGAKPTEDALVALMLGYEANRTEALPDALPRETLH